MSQFLAICNKYYELELDISMIRKFSYFCLLMLLTRKICKKGSFFSKSPREGYLLS